ncbi:MAG: prepilin-type N-terminal cleavage/methylation domain-containing protein [Herminiimonas sp.]|nr:prepilin-type N-terminal cleavage/methylation domain-containing protein [Herminiimonas sp.]
MPARRTVGFCVAVGPCGQPRPDCGPVQPIAQGPVHGFTLVELLVAITVLAAVAVMGLRGLDALTRARDTLGIELEEARRIQLTFAQLQADCANIVDPALLPGRAPLVITANSLVLVRSVRLDGQPTKLKIVAYHLASGTLARRESAATRDLGMLDAAWTDVARPDAQAQDVTLQRDVARMRIRTWQGRLQGWRSPGTDVVSADSGNPAAASGFPAGLEVSLQLRRSRGNMTKVFLLGNL